MVDQFTKWCEIVPLPSQTAEITAKTAVNEFFARFGCPFTIHTDQGRNFESNLFKAICTLLRINKTRTTSYRPSANGQVERYNRTLMDAVRCFVDESQKDWDEIMPQLACTLRSSVNRNTGMTPNKMMLGREVNLPADLVFKPILEETFESEEEYVTKLRENMREAHEVARRQLQTSQEMMKRDYDTNMKQFEYQPGEFVYMLDTAHLKGRAKKLDPPWKGPGIVIERITSYVYKIRLERRTVVTNHDRLKKCNDRTIPSWLQRAKTMLENGKDIEGKEMETIYGICKKPDDGGLMIECDRCLDWFHGSCVDITPKLSATLPIYQCPRCQTPQLYPLRV